MQILADMLWQRYSQRYSQRYLNNSQPKGVVEILIIQFNKGNYFQSTGPELDCILKI